MTSSHGWWGWFLPNFGHMISLIYVQNLATTDPVVSENICLIKIDTDRQTDRGQTDGNGRPRFSYPSRSWSKNTPFLSYFNLKYFRVTKHVSFVNAHNSNLFQTLQTNCRLLRGKGLKNSDKGMKIKCKNKREQNRK